MNMQKADMYDVKLAELKKRLADIGRQEEKVRTYPPCFISYCWQNSRQARDKGTR